MKKLTKKQVLKMLLYKIDKAAIQGLNYVIETEDEVLIRTILKKKP